MQQLKTLSQDALLETLTKSYRRYRKFIRERGSDEFINSRDDLVAILNELKNRRVSVLFWLSPEIISQLSLSNADTRNETKMVQVV